MGCLIFLIVLVLLLGAGMWFTFGLVALLATLLVAGLVGWAADLVVPGGKLPAGWIGAVLTGLVGGWLGELLFNRLGLHGLEGFRLFGVDLIPAFVGAVIVALVVQLVSTRRSLT
jgi:uncharacterized membrane protein YeaQ/YmgE (transglycosylase-associated protein family)